jgi:hypothetical protein
MFPAIVALHLGALHPYEKVLTLLLAFGPFVLLGIVIAVRHRQDLAEERVEVGERSAERAEADDVSRPATPGRPGPRS